MCNEHGILLTWKSAVVFKATLVHQQWQLNGNKVESVSCQSIWGQVGVNVQSICDN